MTTIDGMTSRSLDVPGARLHYEVRGDGPLVLVIGSPMPAADFAPLAHALAGDHTVVTYDPRGLSHSTIDDPRQDATPELRADDVAALIDALGADRADVFGSSGGAVTGLELVTRHPEKVGTLVAHEPPLMELLPDPERQRAATEDIIETFHREGPPAAWMKFMRNAGFEVDQDSGAPVGPPPSTDDQAKQLADMTRFFDHELRYTAHYVPQIDALKKATSSSGSAPIRPIWSPPGPAPRSLSCSASNRSTSPATTADSSARRAPSRDRLPRNHPMRTA